MRQAAYRSIVRVLAQCPYSKPSPRSCRVGPQRSGSMLSEANPKGAALMRGAEAEDRPRRGGRRGSAAGMGQAPSPRLFQDRTARKESRGRGGGPVVHPSRAGPEAFGPSHGRDVRTWLNEVRQSCQCWRPGHRRRPASRPTPLLCRGLRCCTDTKRGRSRRGTRPLTCVELRGFEPLASSMPWRRATNCATAPGACDTVAAAGRARRTAWMAESVPAGFTRPSG
jgi:hypothetical protein